MSVKVFDETRCRRDYHGDSTDEEDDWVFFLRSKYVHGGFWMFASSVEPTRAPSPPAGFSSLGDWVCSRMFFLGSEQTEIHTTSFYF
jgi:hypothetical protein